MTQPSLPTNRYSPTGKFNQPRDEAVRLGRRIAVEFSRGGYQSCREILEQAIREASQPAGLADPLDAPISALGLSVRTLNLLDAKGIATVRDLGNTSQAELLLIPNLGDKALQEVTDAVKQYLKQHGVDWRS